MVGWNIIIPSNLNVSSGLIIRLSSGNYEINILRVAERVIHPRFASEKLIIKANTKIN